MWCAGAFTDRHQWADRGIVTTYSFDPHGLGMIDLGDHMILRHTGLHLRDGAIHRMSADAARLAHQDELGLRLDEPGPVDEIAIIAEARLGQSLGQMRMAARRIIM